MDVRDGLAGFGAVLEGDVEGAEVFWAVGGGRGRGGGFNWGRGGEIVAGKHALDVLDGGEEVGELDGGQFC